MNDLRVTVTELRFKQNVSLQKINFSKNDSQRFRILTTPWRDTQRNVNGIVVEQVQVRLTTSKEGEEV